MDSAVVELAVVAVEMLASAFASAVVVLDAVGEKGYSSYWWLTYDSAYGIGGVNTPSKLGVHVVPGDGAGLPCNYPPDACKQYEGNKFETETKY
jgi:hypothetical protein